MVKQIKRHLFLPALSILLLLALTLGLAGCNRSAGSAAETEPPAPSVLLTGAVKTADAMRLQRLGLTPSPLSGEAMISTAAAAAATPTPDQAAAPTAGPTTAVTPLFTSAAPPAAASGDKADYVADVTIPDGTTFAAGESFDKTWRLLNSGTTTWSTAYELVFIDGNSLGAPASVAMPQEVPPGQQVEITVPMTAPSTAGSYTSYWKLRNATGGLFGLGSEGKEAVWVKINVSGSSEGGSAPTADPNSAVVEVNLSVDEADVVGGCPHTFIFTAMVTLSKPATLTYALQANSPLGGDLRMPPISTRNFEAGVHPIVFEVMAANNFTGQATLQVTQPGSAVSNPVAFSLTCN